MKLKRFKERDNKRIGIIVFTIVCILLVSGVILYRTFAIFEVKTNQNVINGEVQSMGDLEFAFYKEVDGKDTIVKEAPKKSDGYSLDTSSSYCIDMLNNEKISNVNWNYENWSVEIKNVSTTKTKCYLYFKKIYQEEILNGAIPDLGNGRLIPVTISETYGPDLYTGDKGGNVYKADITKTDDPWYSYKDKKWANAVILKTGVEDNYRPGEQIPEENIESYFVWIPRYSYKLQDNEETFNSYSTAEDKGQHVDVQSFYSDIGGNKGASNAFEIEFGSKDKGISSTSLSKGTFIAHPAFETFNSNGFWVGKFETGYNQNSDGSVMPTDSWSTQGAQKNEQSSTKVIIKPSVYSWRNIQVANAFYTSYNYKRELESHMMKNTEWGAVAYLTQSKYGRCTEVDGKSTCDEVIINNNSSYITGMSAANAPTCGDTGTKERCNWYEETSVNIDGEQVQNYYNKKSVVASTTGNYSGIYDMAGGAWEAVMGVMQANEKDTTPATGSDDTHNSGFKGPYSYCSENGGIECNGNSQNTAGKEWPSSKYYDLYDYVNDSSEFYKNGILGDGTKEMGPFYKLKYQRLSNPTESGTERYVGSYHADAAYFINQKAPWFVCGGSISNGTDTGIFAFSGINGSSEEFVTFRIVLTP